jgi:hypothetical protein
VRFRCRPWERTPFLEQKTNKKKGPERHEEQEGTYTSLKEKRDSNGEQADKRVRVK